MAIDSQETREVVLRTDMPFELPPPPFDDSIPIGSETLYGGRTKYIIVEGIDPHQADLFKKTGELDWRIRNCGQPGIVRINDEDVDGERIFKPGERLSLGNIVLELSDDGRKLLIPHDGGGIRIQVDGLTRKTPRRTILDGVSFVAEPGEFVGILGPSGCGKSSLIQAIAGMVPISKGKILVNGRTLSDHPEEVERFQRTCAYLPQNVDNTFHDDFTVREEMSTSRQLRTAEDCDEETVDLSNLKNLDFSADIMDKPVSRLSGGERRRVAIARALALRPKVMLFDEPTAGLDTVSEHDVMERLRDLAHVNGKTIFCVTHVLTRVRDFDRVLLMRPGGKLVFSGKPAEALAKVGGGNVNDANAWERLYKTLETKLKSGDEIWSGYKKPALDESGGDKPLPEPNSQAPSLLRRVLGYLKSFMLTFWHRVAVSLLPFVVPVALAFLLWIACRDGYIFGEAQKTFQSDCYVFAFCSCLTMFWLGLLGSVGTLVRERVPRRCLERLDGVPLYAYLSSKFIWHVIVCFAQSVIFAACLAYCARSGLQPKGLLMGCELWGKLISPLLVCSLSGMFIGMSVSAAFSNETRATEFVPIFAIAQLVLSRMVVDVEKAKGAIVRFTDMMPCRWPIDRMSQLLWTPKSEIDEVLRACGSSWKALVCWSVGCIVFTSIMQSLRERKWQGR